MAMEAAQAIPEPITPPSASDTRGRHWRRAELNRLKQEIRLLEEELEALERLPPASKSCEEFVQFVNTCPDALLPVTHGPVNPACERCLHLPCHISSYFSTYSSHWSYVTKRHHMNGLNRSIQHATFYQHPPWHCVYYLNLVKDDHYKCVNTITHYVLTDQ
ncbi:hypothetical protein O6H91_09G038800 [Diphasiastrum complanatum]|uniref:Uncharacterized protein n=1 Tax=Diphasiastrum complanatum TaxID=34168 RepID=A0ACC2CN57_DIPCM|nr:hypothetical protein O6H91_09G038800 [Diphasiastrum complanatum]